MKTNFFENRIVGITAIIIAILLLLSGIFLIRKNNTLKDQLNTSIIRTEALESENLSVTKSFENLKADAIKLQDQIRTLEESLAETNEKITLKEAEINKLRKLNTNAAVLNKKLKELEQLKSEQEKQLAALNQNNIQLDQKNKELSAMINELQNKNTVLTQNSQILHAMAGNNYRTEALRGKREKLTIRARATHKLVANLDVPTESVKNIKFNVKTPEGDEFSSATDENVEINIPGSSQAQSIKINGETINMSKIELIFSREKKLDKGIYTFDIFNNELYAGSTQIKLR
jgi:DNA repair exonuclease SbcCD ATPase subunit